MGVFHLMGLGKSPGAITAPLSYLAHRYTRWNTSDQHFFSRSGEAQQRQKGQKVGDVQSLVLFTTLEVLTGIDSATKHICHAFPYIDNRPGQHQGEIKPDEPMKSALRLVD